MNKNIIPIGSCTDVCFATGFIYAIRGEGLTPESATYDAMHPDNPCPPGSLVIIDASTHKILSILNNLGNLRQIEISGNFAFITARENGLHIVDISDPASPIHLCNYDTVEMATGIAVSGKLAAVSCRSYGIELIDISISDRPRHLSLIRAGEVQSVTIKDNLLAAGSWGERKVVLCDISDALRPQIISEIPLFGQGDGVCIDGNILYAVTGQSAPGVKEHSLLDPAFGRGNNLEIFDISNPSHPIPLSCTPLTDRFYFIYIDMWDVKVNYPYAYICHTFNGFFVFDISDPRSPKLIDRHQIKMPDDSKYLDNAILGLRGAVSVLPFDHKKDKIAPISGFDISDGVAYLAGFLTDLHIYESKYCKPTPPAPNAFCAHADHYDYMETAQNIKTIRVHDQVHSICVHESFLFAASGSSGILIFDKNDLSYKGCIKTEGIAEYITVKCGLLLCSENTRGLSIWQLNGKTARFLSRIDMGKCVKQLCVSKNGRFVLAINSGTTVSVYDISDPSSPKTVLTHREAPGLIYGRNLVTASGDDIFGCYWNSNIIRWFDLSGDFPVLLPTEARKAPSFPDGFTCIGDKVLMISSGGYKLADKTADDLSSLPVYSAPVPLRGAPTIFENLLIVTDRVEGIINILDITALTSPRLIASLNIHGNPDIACAYKTDSGKPLCAIPAGYEGIILFDLPTE